MTNVRLALAFLFLFPPLLQAAPIGPTDFNAPEAAEVPSEIRATAPIELADPGALAPLNPEGPLAAEIPGGISVSMNGASADALKVEHRARQALARRRVSEPPMPRLERAQPDVVTTIRSKSRPRAAPKRPESVGVAAVGAGAEAADLSDDALAAQAGAAFDQTGGFEPGQVEGELTPLQQRVLEKAARSPKGFVLNDEAFRRAVEEPDRWRVQRTLSFLNDRGLLKKGGGKTRGTKWSVTPKGRSFARVDSVDAEEIVLTDLERRVLGFARRAGASGVVNDENFKRRLGVEREQRGKLNRALASLVNKGLMERGPGETTDVVWYAAGQRRSDRTPVPRRRAQEGVDAMPDALDDRPEVVELHGGLTPLERRILTRAAHRDRVVNDEFLREELGLADSDRKNVAAALSALAGKGLVEKRGRTKGSSWHGTDLGRAVARADSKAAKDINLWSLDKKILRLAERDGVVTNNRDFREELEEPNAAKVRDALNFLAGGDIDFLGKIVNGFRTEWHFTGRRSVRARRASRPAAPAPRAAAPPVLVADVSGLNKLETKIVRKAQVKGYVVNDEALRKAVGVSQRHRVQRALNSLADKGLMESRGYGSGTSWHLIGEDGVVQEHALNEMEEKVLRRARENGHVVNDEDCQKAVGAKDRFQVKYALRSLVGAGLMRSEGKSWRTVWYPVGDFAAPMTGRPVRRTRSAAVAAAPKKRTLSELQTRILEMAERSGSVVNNKAFLETLGATYDQAIYALNGLAEMGRMEKIGIGRWSKWAPVRTAASATPGSLIVGGAALTPPQVDALRQIMEHGPIKNSLDRRSTSLVLKPLQAAGLVEQTGHGAASRWRFIGGPGIFAQLGVSRPVRLAGIASGLTALEAKILDHAQSTGRFIAVDEAFKEAMGARNGEEVEDALYSLKKKGFMRRAGDGKWVRWHVTTEWTPPAFSEMETKILELAFADPVVDDEPLREKIGARGRWEAQAALEFLGMAGLLTAESEGTQWRLVEKPRGPNWNDLEVSILHAALAERRGFIINNEAFREVVGVRDKAQVIGLLRGLAKMGFMEKREGTYGWRPIRAGAPVKSADEVPAAVREPTDLESKLLELVGERSRANQPGMILSEESQSAALRERVGANSGQEVDDALESLAGKGLMEKKPWGGFTMFSIVGDRGAELAKPAPARRPEIGSASRPRRSPLPPPAPARAAPAPAPRPARSAASARPPVPPAPPVERVPRVKGRDGLNMVEATIVALVGPTGGIIDDETFRRKIGISPYESGPALHGLAAKGFMSAETEISDPGADFPTRRKRWKLTDKGRLWLAGELKAPEPSRPAPVAASPAPRVEASPAARRLVSSEPERPTPAPLVVEADARTPLQGRILDFTEKSGFLPESAAAAASFAERMGASYPSQVRIALSFLVQNGFLEGKTQNGQAGWSRTGKKRPAPEGPKQPHLQAPRSAAAPTDLTLSPLEEALIAEALSQGAGIVKNSAGLARKLQGKGLNVNYHKIQTALENLMSSGLFKKKGEERSIAVRTKWEFVGDPRILKKPGPPVEEASGADAAPHDLQNAPPAPTPLAEDDVELTDLQSRVLDLLKGEEYLPNDESLAAAMGQDRGSVSGTLSALEEKNLAKKAEPDPDAPVELWQYDAESQILAYVVKASRQGREISSDELSAKVGLKPEEIAHVIEKNLTPEVVAVEGEGGSDGWRYDAAAAAAKAASKNQGSKSRMSSAAAATGIPTPDERRLLRQLASDGPLPLSSIADRTGHSKEYLEAHIDRLIAIGYMSCDRAVLKYRVEKLYEGP